MGNRSLVLTLNCPEPPKSLPSSSPRAGPEGSDTGLATCLCRSADKVAKRSRRDMPTIPRDSPVFPRRFFRKRSDRGSGVWLNLPGAGLTAAAAQATTLLLPLEFSWCEHQLKRKSGPLAPVPPTTPASFQRTERVTDVASGVLSQRHQVANHSRALTLYLFPDPRTETGGEEKNTPIPYVLLSMIFCSETNSKGETNVTAKNPVYKIRTLHNLLTGYPQSGFVAFGNTFESTC